MIKIYKVKGMYEVKGVTPPIAMKIEIAGRHTKMGAFTKGRIFNAQGDEIQPYMTTYSKTGRHWTDIWYLEKGVYYVLLKDISNSGKHYCKIFKLKIKNGKVEQEELDYIPEKAIPIEFICECQVEMERR
jgi:hypothetical protein